MKKIGRTPEKHRILSLRSNTGSPLIIGRLDSKDTLTDWLIEYFVSTQEAGRLQCAALTLFPAFSPVSSSRQV